MTAYGACRRGTAVRGNSSCSNGNYVAVRNGRVVVHNGANWHLLDVGALDDYLVSASAAGF